MGKRKISLRTFFETTIDHCKLSVSGILKLLKRPKYLIAFLLSLFCFLFILSFFKDGSGNWSLLWSPLGFSRKISLIGQVLLDILANFSSLYGIIILLMALLQALIVPLLIYTWKQRVQDAKNKDNAIDGASTSGIGAILGFVALGCPSCGVGLLMPILTAIAGASALAVAETVSHLFTIVAFWLLFYTVVRLGYLSFINICNEKSKEEKKKCKK